MQYTPLAAAQMRHYLESIVDGMTSLPGSVYHGPSILDDERRLLNMFFAEMLYHDPEFIAKLKKDQVTFSFGVIGGNISKMNAKIERVTAKYNAWKMENERETVDRKYRLLLPQMKKHPIFYV